MRALLDVNVLIALLDELHQHHQPAKAWFMAHAVQGWATCVLTQNGFVRIMSQPRYPRPITVAHAMQLLDQACRSDLHEFWPADVSLLDDAVVDRTRVHGPGQLTDLCLLALAVKHRGRLVTFDDAIPLSAVRGARREHVAVV